MREVNRYNKMLHERFILINYLLYMRVVVCGYMIIKIFSDSGIYYFIVYVSVIQM